VTSPKEKCTDSSKAAWFETVISPIMRKPKDATLQAAHSILVWYSVKELDRTEYICIIISTAQAYSFQASRGFLLYYASEDLFKARHEGILIRSMLIP